MQSLGHNRLNISGTLWFAGHRSLAAIRRFDAAFHRFSSTDSLRWTRSAILGSVLRASLVTANGHQERFARTPPGISRQLGQFGWIRSNEAPLEKFEYAARA